MEPKISCNMRLLEVKDTKINFMDREPWKYFVSIVNGCVNAQGMAEITFSAKLFRSGLLLCGKR